MYEINKYNASIFCLYLPKKPSFDLRSTRVSFMETPSKIGKLIFGISAGSCFIDIQYDLPVISCRAQKLA